MYYENPDGVSVHYGFPNPASDTSLQSLDLNSLLIRHSVATYFMRIQGNDWQAVGLFDGDLIIIDRALAARGNDLVIWQRADQFSISHISDVEKGCAVWGVVTAAIHLFKDMS